MNFDEEFEPFEQDDESSPWASAERKAVKAYELYENGQMNESLAVMNEALDINPTNDRWHFNKALTLDAMERFSEAIEEYQMALDLNPNDVEILNCLAVDYTRTGQYDLSLSVFSQIEKIRQDFEPCYCNRIITYTEMGEYDSAEQMFYQAQQINEHCPLCFYNIGNLFFIRGNYKKAVWCWEKTANLEPNHPQINYRIAQGYWNLSNRNMAWRHFIEELKKNPGDKDVIFDFGLFLLHNGDVAGAAEKFNRILETEPDYAGAVFYLGEIELNRGNLLQAEKYYCRAVQLDCRLAGPRFRLGQLALQQGRKEEAFGLLASELELDIQQSKILLSIGLMMAELGKTDYAIHCFLRVSELEPLNGINYLNLAKMLALGGEYDEAEQFLDYAFEIEPKNCDIAVKAAKIYLSMKNPRKALLILTTAWQENKNLSCGLLLFSIRLRLLLSRAKEKFRYLFGSHC
ncbi:MAG: tetratricopeptide repeat protein [Sedimentisphaerales bacterium]